MTRSIRYTYKMVLTFTDGSVVEIPILIETPDLATFKNTKMPPFSVLKERVTKTMVGDTLDEDVLQPLIDIVASGIEGQHLSDEVIAEWVDFALVPRKEETASVPMSPYIRTGIRG